MTPAQFMALRILCGKGEVQIMPFRKLSGKCHFLLRFCACNWSETYIIEGHIKYALNTKCEMNTKDEFYSILTKRKLGNSEKFLWWLSVFLWSFSIAPAFAPWHYLIVPTDTPSLSHISLVLYRDFKPYSFLEDVPCIRKHTLIESHGSGTEACLVFWLVRWRHAEELSVQHQLQMNVRIVLVHHRYGKLIRSVVRCRERSVGNVETVTDVIENAIERHDLFPSQRNFFVVSDEEIHFWNFKRVKISENRFKVNLI